MNNIIRTKIAALVAILGILTGFSGCTEFFGTELSEGGLTVHFIDVGQADAALIECGGEAMMIDGGNAADSNLVVSYLKDARINHLKYVVGTHAHEDHIGGLAGVLSQYSADMVFCSQDSYDTKAFKNFKKYTEKQGKKIQIPKTGDVLTLGTSELEILGPINETDKVNNRSIVIRLDYGNTSFLFEGDAEYEEEQDILDSGAYVSADVLKVGHHGSRSSSSYSYIREVMPAYSIISCGKDNDYGHPHEQAISRLRDSGTQIYRTDELGSIVVRSDGNEITITTEK